jgi:NTE family protein
MANKSAKSATLKQRPPFHTIALLLQGGGALGAYQAGVYQALDEYNIQPDWVLGTSIGAYNAAIIAGNRPEDRVQKLRGFWEAITVKYVPDDLVTAFPSRIKSGEFLRRSLNELSAFNALSYGAKGLFKNRFLSPWLEPSGTPEATSYYDTSESKDTLLRFVDFDILNASKVRFGIEAVDVISGNSVFFENKTRTITPEHVMASAALPPGFPAVEIQGRYYWDGGVISNTPLQKILEEPLCEDTLIFQVDLWGAKGELPTDMPSVMTRQKEIQYSSRTRSNTDRFKETQKLRYAIAALLDKLPETHKNIAEAVALKSIAIRKVYNIVHLIYRSRNYEGHSKDYEFSRLSMEDHWQSGYFDTIHTLRHPEVLEKHGNRHPVRTFDYTQNGSGARE